jgi:hypothetical protein
VIQFHETPIAQSPHSTPHAVASTNLEKNEEAGFADDVTMHFISRLTHLNFNEIVSKQ